MTDVERFREAVKKELHRKLTEHPLITSTFDNGVWQGIQYAIEILYSTKIGGQSDGKPH